MAGGRGGRAQEAQKAAASAWDHSMAKTGTATPTNRDYYLPRDHEGCRNPGSRDVIAWGQLAPMR